MSLPSKTECNRALARTEHFEFMQYCWQRPDPFIVAKDNPFQIQICKEIDDAIERYKKGESSFLCFNVCFGHGKSDISSRYLPPHFLGEFPDSEVLVVSHTDDKANEFGNFGRLLFQSDEFRQLYPNLQLSKSNHGVEEWGIADRFGKAQYIGIQTGTAGKRGNLIVVDDFFGKREQAESETLRNKVWTSFTDDVMTRRAPVSIVLLVVTPWHVDDPIARIKNEMEKNKDFPKFKFVNYPAESESYKTGWLFSERFSEAWYTTQKSVLGNYGYQSLMQCDPETRGGNLLRTDKIHIVSMDGKCETCGQVHEWPNLQKIRAWDLASSVKQTQKKDPDFTSGPLGGIILIPSAIPGVHIPIIYVEDWIRGQWEATQRQTIIRDAAIADGTIKMGMEAFGAYKDAFTEMEKILSGIRTVEKKQLEGDKIVKASPMIPAFEAGNVYFRKGPWNEPVKKQLGDFPSGVHDDDVDALSVLFEMGSRPSVIQIF
jgi:predicted phage terminase large subunit-like protein